MAATYANFKCGWSRKICSPRLHFTIFPKINKCFLYVFKCQYLCDVKDEFSAAFYSSLQCHMIILVCLIDAYLVKHSNNSFETLFSFKSKTSEWVIESCILLIHSKMLIQSETVFALRHNSFSTALCGAFSWQSENIINKQNNYSNNVTENSYSIITI